MTHIFHKNNTHHKRARNTKFTYYIWANWKCTTYTHVPTNWIIHRDHAFFFVAADYCPFISNFYVLFSFLVGALSLFLSLHVVQTVWICYRWFWCCCCFMCVCAMIVSSFLIFDLPGVAPVSFPCHETCYNWIKLVHIRWVLALFLFLYVCDVIFS